MKRSHVGGLSLSAAALVALIIAEGYSDKAIIPTKNDVPTVGFGSTYHADGTRVRMGDTIDPVRAVATAYTHISKDERLFRDSIPNVPLYQAEYDVYMDFTYQYGIGNWMVSSMRSHLIRGEYQKACDALLMRRKAGGYDCSTTVNGQPNKVCWGVWTRQLERHARCIGADQ